MPTNLPLANAFSDTALTNAGAKQAQNDILAFLRQSIVGANAVATLNTASAVITPTRAVHRVDTENSAATSNLDRIAITNTVDNQFMVLTPVDPARVVTIRHAQGGIGQIVLRDGANLNLATVDAFILLWRDGNNWREVFRSAGKSPTRQYITASGTYITPVGCRQIIVRMVGGGGGGAGYGSGGNGGDGGGTTFGSVAANGGKGGTVGSPGSAGAGGTGGTGTAAYRQQGGSSSNGSATAQRGGDSRLGFGAPGNAGVAGFGAAANSGGGGGAAGTGSASQTANGPGGGAEYVEIVIPNPATSYAVTIGAGGNAGAGNNPGGGGGTGLIIVDETY